MCDDSACDPLFNWNFDSQNIANEKILPAVTYLLSQKHEHHVALCDL